VNLKDCSMGLSVQILNLKNFYLKNITRDWENVLENNISYISNKLLLDKDKNQLII
jgi:hypothetical protein